MAAGIIPLQRDDTLHDDVAFGQGKSQDPSKTGPDSRSHMRRVAISEITSDAFWNLIPALGADDDHDYHHGTDHAADKRFF